MNKFTKVLIVAALSVMGATSAMAYDRHSNPPGPVGGPGTNWHNPPGPVGGPGASPSWHHRALKRAAVHHHRYHHHHHYRYFAHHHGHPMTYDHYGPHR